MCHYKCEIICPGFLFVHHRDASLCDIQVLRFVYGFILIVQTLPPYVGLKFVLWLSLRRLAGCYGGWRPSPPEASLQAVAPSRPPASPCEPPRAAPTTPPSSPSPNPWPPCSPAPPCHHPARHHPPRPTSHRRWVAAAAAWAPPSP